VDAKFGDKPFEDVFKEFKTIDNHMLLERQKQEEKEDSGHCNNVNDNDENDDSNSDSANGDGDDDDDDDIVDDDGDIVVDDDADDDDDGDEDADDDDDDDNDDEKEELPRLHENLSSQESDDFVPSQFNKVRVSGRDRRVSVRLGSPGSSQHNSQQHSQHHRQHAEVTTSQIDKTNTTTFIKTLPRKRRK
jgi:hypothetical protein